MVLLTVLAFAAAPIVASGSKSRGLLLRHCVRATEKDEELHGYPAVPLPAWGVPGGWCTERGEALALQTGKFLNAHWGVQPDSVRIFSDTKKMRTGHTASTLIRGLGASHEPLIYDNGLFSTTEPATGKALCEKPPANVTLAERRARAQAVKPPQDFSEAMTEMQTLIGVGPAGPLSGLGNLSFDQTGAPVGAAVALRLLGQIALYAYGSGMQFGNATPEQAYRLGAWHHWYRSVRSFNSETVTANARLMHALLEGLSSEADTTDIFVGHDDNLDGIVHLLGFSSGWDIPPFVSLNGPSCATPPNSGLWFEHDHASGAVELSYIYVPFEEAQAPSMENFSLKHKEFKRWESLAALKAFVQERLALFAGAEECFHKAASLTNTVLV